MSPNKTKEGFLGGVAMSIGVAVLLALYLTSLSFWHAAILGAIVACSGFIGDITMSTLERDLQIKHTGNLLPINLYHAHTHVIAILSLIG